MLTLFCLDAAGLETCFPHRDLDCVGEAFLTEMLAVAACTVFESGVTVGVLVVMPSLCFDGKGL